MQNDSRRYSCQTNQKTLPVSKNELFEHTIVWPAGKPHLLAGILQPEDRFVLCFCFKFFEGFLVACHNRLLPRLRKKDPAAVIVDVCSCVSAKLSAGDYANLKAVVAEPWRRLMVADKASVEEVDSLDSEDEPKLVTRKRHDLDSLLKWFRQNGPTGTFAASVCKIALETGDTARLVYVMPKHQLDHTEKRKLDMSAALRLSLSTTEDDVFQAAAAAETGSHESR